MAFYDLEMETLGKLQRDEYAPDMKMGDAPIKTTSYKFVQVGQHPYTNHIVGYVEGDEDAFTKDVGDGGVVITSIPREYQQTCVNEILYGRTLTKAVIVWSKYPIHEELRILRTMLAIQRADENAANNKVLSVKQLDVINRADGLKSEFDAYSEFVAGIPEDA